MPLNPDFYGCSAIAKGHMKRARHGIKNTWAKPILLATELPQSIPQIIVPIIPLGQEMRAYPGPAYGRRQDPRMIEMYEGAMQRPNLIGMDDEDAKIANVFCFGAFADKTSCIVYNDLTGSFPFVLLDRSICFFVLYHYKFNCILATPIKGMDDKTIFETYKISRNSPQKDSNRNSTQWTTRLPNTSNSTYLKTSANCNSLSHTTTESMRQSGPSKHLRMCL